jgi:hypothetical protein
VGRGGFPSRNADVAAGPAYSGLTRRTSWGTRIVSHRGVIKTRVFVIVTRRPRSFFFGAFGGALPGGDHWAIRPISAPFRRVRRVMTEIVDDGNFSARGNARPGSWIQYKTYKVRRICVWVCALCADAYTRLDSWTHRAAFPTRLSSPGFPRPGILKARASQKIASGPKPRVVNC